MEPRADTPPRLLWRSLTLMAWLAALTGCESTSDPTRGGLFGYWSSGPGSYEGRLAQRRNTLQEMQAASAEQQTQTQRLAASLALEESRTKNLSAELARLDSEARAMEKSATTTAQKRAISEVRLKVAQARAKAAALRGAGSTDSGRMTTEINALRSSLEEIKSQIRP